ncbi:hypothetical protein ACQWF0_24855, partial [Salmonella enterica subsp. enterica serovar Infantis]
IEINTQKHYTKPQEKKPRQKKSTDKPTPLKQDPKELVYNLQTENKKKPLLLQYFKNFPIHKETHYPQIKKAIQF